MAQDNVLNQEDLQVKLNNLDNWEVKNDKMLHRQFDFKNFKEALAFTNKVGEIAEDKMHHPDIYLTWGKVEIDITTHEADGLTNDDFDLAKEIDSVEL